MNDVELLTKLFEYTRPECDNRKLAIKLLDKYGSIGNVIVSDDEFLDEDTRILLKIIKTSARKMIWENLDGVGF